MLYVFHGSNTPLSSHKASALIASLRTKKTDASYVRIEAGQWSPSIIEEHLGGQGLFSNKYIIFLDRVTENSEAKDGLVESVSVMQESPNIFIVLEGKVNAELTKAFEKHAEKIVVSDMGAPTGAPKEEFNIFALADAVGSRDSFKAWTMYRQAIDRGTEPENIIGTIFWQLKSMMLAAHSSSASESGLSPFVFSKAKKAAGYYSTDELRELTRKFITLYHDGHRGKVNMELGAERILLSIS
jgi:DNA polymerase III delta subunit